MARSMADTLAMLQDALKKLADANYSAFERNYFLFAKNKISRVKIQGFQRVPCFLQVFKDLKYLRVSKKPFLSSDF